MTTSKASPLLLGEHTLPLLFSCLRATIHEHPGGMIHGLSRSLGANEELALEAAVCGELFFAACNLTDDLQDGEAGRYLDGVSFAVQLNTQSLLYSLAGVAVNAFMRNSGSDSSSVELFATVCRMLTGQQLELERSHRWDASICEQVAYAIAGEQFGVYFALAGAAAQQSLPPLVRVGVEFGALTQLIVDAKSGDQRLLSLPLPEQEAMRARVTQRLDTALEGVDPRLSEQVALCIPR